MFSEEIRARAKEQAIYYSEDNLDKRGYEMPYRGKMAILSWCLVDEEAWEKYYSNKYWRSLLGMVLMFYCRRPDRLPMLEHRSQIQLDFFAKLSAELRERAGNLAWCEQKPLNSLWDDETTTQMLYQILG